MKNFTKFLFASLALIAITLFIPSDAAANLVTHFSTPGVLTAGTSFAAVAGAAQGDRSRAIFKSLQTGYPGKVISPGFLRIEQTITNTSGQLKFDIKSTSTTIVTETKLDRNDLFVADRIGIYLIRQEDAKLGNAILNTYPNETTFAAVAGFVPADLEGIYNGFFSLKVGSTVEIERLSMQEFRKVPETQRSAATNKDQYDAAQAVYYPSTLIKLFGNKDIDTQVNYNNWAAITAAAVTAGFTHKLVFMPYGHLVKDGAVS